MDSRVPEMESTPKIRSAQQFSRASGNFSAIAGLKIVKSRFFEFSTFDFGTKETSQHRIVFFSVFTVVDFPVINIKIHNRLSVSRKIQPRNRELF